MTITPHILTGAAIGSVVANPDWAFLFGIFSHIILDMIPHLDPGTFHDKKIHGDKWPLWIYLFATGELIFATLLVYFLFRNKADFESIAWGAFGGILIDLIDNGPFRFIRKWPGFKQLHFIHEKIHYKLARDKWYWGALTSILIAGGAIWLSLKY